jgi:hypothetical protein
MRVVLFITLIFITHAYYDVSVHYEQPNCVGNILRLEATIDNECSPATVCLPKENGSIEVGCAVQPVVQQTGFSLETVHQTTNCSDPPTQVS